MSQAERQSRLPEAAPLTRRHSLANALERRRIYDKQIGQWNSRATLVFIALASNWREFKGAEIASNSGAVVEDISSEMTYLKTEDDFREVLKRLKRAGVPANQVARFMAKDTSVVARKTEDQIGWTGKFLSDAISILGDQYHLSDSYIQKLKTRSLQKSLPI